MKSAKILLILVTFVLCLNFSHSQSFQSYCSVDKPCDPDKFLKCVSNSCQCGDPENQIFDPIEDQCVIVAGKRCNPELAPGIQLCVQGAECNVKKSICECSKGFYETELNICSYNIGKFCKVNYDCDTGSGLHCQNGVCKCSNPSSVWQLEYGCVSSAEHIGVGNVSFTTSTESSTTAKEQSPPVGNPIMHNIIPDSDSQEGTEMTTLVPGSFTWNTSSEDYDDRAGIPSKNPISSIINNLIPPILNPLNPNHPLRPARPTFVPATSDTSSSGSQNRPSAIFQPGQISQSNPNGTRPQFPPNELPNVFVPAQPPPGIINPTNQRPLRPTDLLNLRRLVQPFKRFFFPRLFAASPGDLEFPSPIWLAVSSVNQILPILRVIDYQMAPVLQNIAAITRPRYLDKLVQQQQEQQALNQGLGQRLGQRQQWRNYDAYDQRSGFHQPQFRQPYNDNGPLFSYLRRRKVTDEVTSPVN